MNIVHLFSTWMSDIPARGVVFVLAMLPVTELRASIPLAITVWGLDPMAAIFWSMLGNLVVIGIVFFLFPSIVDFARAHLPTMDRALDSYIERLERKYRHKYIRFGLLLLFLFVAIPFPGTGAWTASVVAVIFEIPKRASALTIALGLLVSAFLVTLLTVSGLHMFGL
jgi:uncharacterized membrane protein